MSIPLSLTQCNTLHSHPHIRNLITFSFWKCLILEHFFDERTLDIAGQFRVIYVPDAEGFPKSPEEEMGIQ